MYILFVIFHNRWSGNKVLYSLSVRIMLLFVMRISPWVMIATVWFICLIASKMLRWTFGELITESCFSGRISRVQFVVNRLFTTIVVVSCSMQRLQIVFWTVPYLTQSCSFGVSGGAYVRTSTILLGLLTWE